MRGPIPPRRRRKKFDAAFVKLLWPPVIRRRHKTKTAAIALSMQISDYSVWLMVAVTFERYLVVCHPFRASTFCGTPVARRLVIGFLLAFLGLNSHFFWTVGVLRYCLHGQPHYLCSAADSNYVVLVTVNH